MGDCRPIGGFGTCVKDVDFLAFGGEPSPMDRILADIQQSTNGQWPEEAPTILFDSETSAIAVLSRANSSSSGTTISTPQHAAEDSFQDFVCFRCGDLWSPYEFWTQYDLCQSCSSLYPGGILPDESTIYTPANTDKCDHLSGLSDWILPTRTNVGNREVPPLSHASEELGGIIAQLDSLNLVV